ncbi:tail fiber domain-containing protein [Escherichia coli]|uniref:phage tail fiber protein n=1 Tax=Escherichia coli TaxID=562 RepID=UPI000F53ABCF|nr:tail fiber domain-containing protein [Escherichia coli]EFI4252499.1 tail fiber domain-containing protein [Escherichia coli]EIY5900358.1 tail fiber domain-containing protein [Escherichia coli]EJM1704601.1 tail fiber domain-containing protein [Escherichia coli]EKE9456386.1 tail fiber domain-containing protein [Escherichia coli]EKF1852931.1 tail fiber domain-containing protein [Escherichia coli]
MQSIQFKRTQTAGKKPTPEQLSQGELAINLADHVLYTKDKNNAVVQISVSPEKHAELNTKVDQNKTSTDRVIASNKQEAANNLASAKAELNQTITTKDTATNKRIDATNTTVSNLTQTVTENKTDADTKINNLTGTVSANKTAIERTVAANKSDADSKHAALTKTVTDNNTAINNKVNTTNTNVSNLTKTVTANKTDADNKISSLTSTVAANKTAIEKTVSDNKKDADTKITNLTGTVNSNHTAINNKVDQNKSSTDAAIAAANKRIDGIEGSNDALYIKKNTNTKHGGYLLSKTANYLEDQTSRDLNYFGAFRTNGQDGLMDLTLNVPHSSGKAHGRGFTFRYASGGSRVETYGFDREGQKNFSYKMYHEGDKPTPAEIGAYTKGEIDKMFIKNVTMSVPSGSESRAYFKIATATIPQNGRMVMLRIFGGNGYNVNSYDQVDFLEIVIRSGNNNPKGVSIAAYRRNSLNVHQVFAVNTSGDNYDIYVNYGRYTDNVIVEYGKTSGVSLTVHDTPAMTNVKPSTGVTDGRVITMFNTENKAGTLMFDNNGQGTYDIVSLNNDSGTGKKYLRKFRSKAAETIWHETVQGNVYRLATGTTDSSEVLRITGRTMFTGKGVLDAGQNVLRLERPSNQSNYIEWQDRRNGADARQGWIGFGSAETNNFMWYSDHGKNSFQLEANGQCSISTGANKLVYTNGEYCSGNSNAYRMAFGNYGAFWRNDGGKVYLLSTDENDKLGGWNTYRPFIYDLTSGNVQLGGDGNEDALTLERASRAARFSNNVYIKKGFLTFDAGRSGSRDYIRFNHWGDSNNARDNVLYIEDSQGRHFSTERAMGTGALKANFLGDLEVGGKFTWGKNTATSSFNIRAWGSDSRKQVLECADESGWHWYTQRAGGPGTNEINFSVNGSIHSQGIATSGNIKITGPDIEFRRTGNKHIWFRDPNGLELGLMYCDDAGVIRFRGQKQGQTWKLADKMIHLEAGTVGGSDKGLIRGNVAGGSWASWRDRSAGILVDCPNSTDSAHNIWKATHWGKYHIAAMGVHVPSGTITNALARLNVHDANFDFNAAGDFSAGRNGSFNDVYIRSDSRLKINKEELQDGALEKVNSLKVYTYDKVKSLKDRSVIKREVGIIAQDLEEVLPEAVGIQSTEDPEQPEAIKTISNSAVNALIIKAIQEMDAKYQAKIEALTKEIAELKATK